MGLGVLLLGALAVAVPFFGGKTAPFTLGLLLLASGVLELTAGFRLLDQRVGNSAFLGSAMSIVAGVLLIAEPSLAVGAGAVLVGLSFALDGVGKAVAGLRNRGRPGWAALVIDGGCNVALGGLIAAQWPVPGAVTLGLVVGLRVLASGWALFAGRAAAPVPTEAEAAQMHPDAGLGLPPHPELARLREALDAENAARGPIDRYWCLTFLLTFFAIHVGRMDAEWNPIGLLSPGVAVAGDVVYALLLTWCLVTPVQLAWRWLTRPVERRAWRRLLAGVDQGRPPSARERLTRRWLTGRFRLAARLGRCRRSPTAALARGLQVGLPLAAVLIALNPIWGLSWYFNTENWVTGLWEKWTEYRVDDWRGRMVQAVREQSPNVPEDRLFQVHPEGVAGSADFSFIVIGDTGEGGAAQFSLKDRLVLLGQRPDVKFLVVSSDVIYPQGAMRHYEPNFYLPFKGFTKPIYAMPGNHDWYDALEAFAANFLEPDPARAAMQARVEADHGLTATSRGRIEGLVGEAARLRGLYGVSTGHQRAPYFEVQGDRFALVVVDTGILRTVDPGQVEWLRAALGRARGKFKMAVLGHPLYAGGHYQGERDEPFAALHRILREFEVNVVMAGDTHSLEYYRDAYPAGGGERPMHHFVNGGGGAYLSIGTPLAWPDQTPVADCGFYPRPEELVAKLDAETPAWKWPVWFWVKRLGGWPSSAEGLAAAFVYNRAPFFQSFVEVRVEGSANRVRLLPHGVNGPLRWRDFQLFGRVMPDGRSADDPAEWVVPMR
jgi:uncharacterized membrane protein HdeD (DUF308 family)